MKGEIDQSGRVLLTLSIGGETDSSPTELVVWIDTVFDGELVIAQRTIDKLSLAQSSAVEATLADGSKVLLETYECSIDWFGSKRQVEVIANEGRLPLLGIGLLKERKLTIDYRHSMLELN